MKLTNKQICKSILEWKRVRDVPSDLTVWLTKDGVYSSTPDFYNSLDAQKEHLWPHLKKIYGINQISFTHPDKKFMVFSFDFFDEGDPLTETSLVSFEEAYMKFFFRVIEECEKL